MPPAIPLTSKAFLVVLLAEYFLVYLVSDPAVRVGSATWSALRTLQALVLIGFAAFALRQPRMAEPTTRALILYGITFLGAHILLGIVLWRQVFLRFDALAVESTIRYVDTFFTWTPLLTLGIFAGLGWGRRISLPNRLALLLGFAFALCVLGAIATPGDNPPNCNLQPNHPLCQAAPAFSLLLQLTPIPAFIFLFANGRHHWTIGQCFGLALASFSLWTGVYGSLSDLLVIASGGAVLGPTPAIQFYRSFFHKALWEVGYVILGLFFIFRRVPGLHRPFRFGNEVERVLRPLGAWTRRSTSLDLAWGATLFIPLAITAITFTWLLSQGPTGDVGDDSAVFNEITFDLVFLLSIAAGVGEEILFRGFLQSALERLIVFRGWPRAALGVLAVGVLTAVGLGTYNILFVDVLGGVLLMVGLGALTGVIAMSLGWGGFGIAILLQALLFGVFHAGYGDLDHVIVPLMFGIFAGIIYRLFGLLAIILIHVEIDVFAFAASYNGAHAVWLNNALVWLFLLQTAFAIVFAILRLILWFERRGRNRRAAPTATPAQGSTRPA